MCGHRAIEFAEIVCRGGQNRCVVAVPTNGVAGSVVGPTFQTNAPATVPELHDEKASIGLLPAAKTAAATSRSIRILCTCRLPHHTGASENRRPRARNRKKHWSVWNIEADFSPDLTRLAIACDNQRRSVVLCFHYRRQHRRGSLRDSGRTAIDDDSSNRSQPTVPTQPLGAVIVTPGRIVCFETGASARRATKEQHTRRPPVPGHARHQSAGRGSPVRIVGHPGLVPRRNSRFGGAPGCSHRCRRWFVPTDSVQFAVLAFDAHRTSESAGMMGDEIPCRHRRRPVARPE